jgi:hypothetical protein
VVGISEKCLETPVVLWIQNARVVRVKRSGEIRRHAGGKG